MGVVNLGQVAALIQSVTTETLPEGTTPTVRNEGTKANADLVFGLPAVITKAKVQELINTQLIKHYKNGYIQLPGMPSPLEDVNLHFEGYSWHEVNYDGNFFRAKGRNAKAFSSVKLTAEQIKNGTYAFQDDEQGDSIRNIKGWVSFESGNIMTESDGAFSYETFERIRSWADGGGWPTQKLYFDASKADGVKVAEENRSRNLTFTIWALVKDE